MNDKHQTLRDYLKVISTGPLSLRDAIIAALAYVAGVVPIIDVTNIYILRQHTGGWFGLAAEVKALLVDVEARRAEWNAYRKVPS